MSKRSERLAQAWLSRQVTAAYSPEFYRAMGIRPIYRHPETGNLVVFQSLPSETQKEFYEKWKARQGLPTSRMRRKEFTKLRDRSRDLERGFDPDEEAAAVKADRKEMAEALKKLKERRVPAKIFNKERRRLIQELEIRAQKRKQEREEAFAQKVSSLWIRKAISQNWVLDLQKNMKNRDLSFNHLFGDKKRIVVPASELRPEFSKANKSALEDTLFDLDELDAEDRVDWTSGKVTTHDGKTKRLGKAISKAQKKFQKEHPEAWKVLKENIKNRRAFDKHREKYVERVQEPLEDIWNHWAEQYPHQSLDEVWKRLYEFYQELRPDEKDESPLAFLRPGIMGKNPQRIPELDGKVQKEWAQGMKQILSLTDEDLKRAETKASEYEDKLKKTREEAQVLADRMRESKTPGDPKKLRSLNQEADKYFNKFNQFSFLKDVVENLPNKEALANSIERSVNEMAEASGNYHDSESRFRDLTEGKPKAFSHKLYQQRNLEKARQDYDMWKAEAKDGKSLVLSRAPVDVLRMSDHPTAPQAIQSCHSEGSSYFQCAVEEAHGNGLVGYVVDDEDLKKVDLEADEIFEDVDRGVDGIKPRSRIRFRRFEHKEDGSELALPELQTYGTTYGNLTELATQWAREAQKDHIKPGARMSDYVLTGGSYRDHSDSSLFNNFFGNYQESGDTEHRRENRPSSENLELDLDQFWGWMEDNYQTVPNPNPQRRKKDITPETLRGYAEKGSDFSDRAKQMVQRYMHTYLQQKKTQAKVAAKYLLNKVAQSKRKPWAWADTETTGIYPKNSEILSLSLLNEEGEPLVNHPRTGKPLHEVRIKPKNLAKANPYALEVNKYPAWKRFLEEEVKGPEGGRKPRKEIYSDWKSNRDQLKELEKQWADFVENPSDEEDYARLHDEWSDAVGFDEVAPQIAEVMKTHRLAGHNVAFDRDFFESDLKKAGHDVKVDPELVDTMALSYLAGIPANKLTTTTEALGIPLGENAHGAYPDTEAARQVHKQLKDPRRVEEVRNQSKQKYGGPARGVMFAAMETTGDHPYHDNISSLAIVDHHGRKVFEASFGEGPGKVKPEDAVEEIADIYQDNMFGGDNPVKNADFVRNFIRKHSPKREDNGKPKYGFYSPVLDTATLRHVYGAGRRPSKKGSLADQARAEAETFHEVADQAFGPSQPHRNPRKDFESWASGRTFRNPLPRDRRKKEFITYATLKNMAVKGLGNGEEDIMRRAQKSLARLQKQYEDWQARVKKYEAGF